MARRTLFLCRFFLVKLCLLQSLFVLSCITAAHGHVSCAEDARRVRGYTRFQEDSVNSLLSLRESTLGRDDFAGVASALVEEIREELKAGSSMFSLAATENSGGREAIAYCMELMDMSSRRLNQSMDALEVAATEKKDDIQTWLTGVLTFMVACKDSLGEVQSPLYSKMERLSVLSSNALAMANRIPVASGIGSSQFPKWVLADADIKAAAVVAADGSGDFTAIKDALASTASKGGRTAIFLKAGVYKEKLRITRDDVTLIGEGKHSTIITYDSSAEGGASMPSSATVSVTGDRFIAKNVGFENSAGPSGGQAVALRILSDHAVLFRCSIRGYQDTLYAQAFRQFYRECDIHGTIDFIFGNAAAVFQNCNLVLRRPRPGSYNVIMASGRTDPYQNSGFVVQKCKIQASSDLSAARRSVKSYLGRPWKEHARTVVIESFIEDCIHPRGWIEKSGGFALRTLYFAEGLNKGPGAGTSKRVDWPGFHALSAGESSKFTVSNFIKGTSWISSTGVTYEPGL